jgi:DnaJ-class molecular chaperone
MTIPCSKCQGDGTIEWAPYGDITRDRSIRCPECSGSGATPCGWCGEPSEEEFTREDRGGDVFLCSRRCLDLYFLNDEGAVAHG